MPSFVDRIIDVARRPFAADRAVSTPARREPTMSYQAASQRPRLVGWNPPGSGPNQALDGSIETLRARSRDAVRQMGYAEAGVETLVSNIVGSGIKPQFATPDAAFNQQLSELFLEWTDEADTDGRLDFYGLQALAVRSMIEGGDCFSRLRARLPQDGLSVPLQLQVMESEFCPPDKNGIPAAPGNSVRCGVEFDLIGRRYGYHLYRSHPNDRAFFGGSLVGVADLAFVPASEIVQMALIRRPGMVRGEPWLTRALVKLNDLDKYDDAQLVRQQIAALYTGFITQDGTELGEEEAILGGEVGAAGTPDAGVELVSLEPGTMQELPAGRTVNWSEPPTPGDNYADFMREQKRAMAVSLGILYEQLTGDFSTVNDRTFRAAANEFRRRCTMWQHHVVVFQWCRPILQRWVELGILSGAIKLPPGVSIGQVVRARWVPDAWAYINPVQDVQAKQLEVRAGFTSRRAVVSAGGEDIEQIDAEIASDNERADGEGLIFDSDPRKTTSAGASAGQGDEPQPPAPQN